VLLEVLLELVLERPTGAGAPVGPHAAARGVAGHGGKDRGLQEKRVWSASDWLTSVFLRDCFVGSTALALGSC
jgi:hypothetical protein